MDLFLDYFPLIAFWKDVLLSGRIQYQALVSHRTRYGLNQNHNPKKKKNEKARLMQFRLMK